MLRECNKDRTQILADLENRELYHRQYQTRKKTESCALCLRTYAALGDLRQLTEYEVSDLFRKYEQERSAQISAERAENIARNLARADLEKSRDKSCKSEDVCSEEATLNAQAEQEQRDRKAAEKRKREEDLRDAVVRRYIFSRKTQCPAGHAMHGYYPR